MASVQWEALLCRSPLITRSSSASASSAHAFRFVVLSSSHVGAPFISAKRRCDCYDHYDRLISYKDAWKWQKDEVEARIQCIRRGNGDDDDDDVGNDAVILLQHPPVYTLGTRSSEEYILFDKHESSYDILRTERGGEVTYHGPGQLVMYPVLNLRHHRMDLHWYLRALEEVVIRALWSSCGIEARRIEGLTGVWVGDAKVAAIGIRVSHWVSYHGLALNVTTDLAPFKRIVPCGIEGRPVGSVLEILKSNACLLENNSHLLKRSLNSMNRAGHGSSRLVEDDDIIDRDALLESLRDRLLVEFSDYFQLELIFK